MPPTPWESICCAGASLPVTSTPGSDSIASFGAAVNTTHGRSNKAALHHRLFPNSARAPIFARGNGLVFSCISVYPGKTNVVLHAVTHAEGARS